MPQAIPDTTDDSLLLGWKKTGAVPGGGDKYALSVSSIKLFDEDPHKWYLRKVEKLKEPFSMPLAFGSAAHDAMEKFFSTTGSPDDRVKASMVCFETSMRSNFARVEKPQIRINPDDPMNPRDKQEVDVDMSDMIALAEKVLQPVLMVLSRGDEPGYREYSPFLAQKPNGLAVERILGEEAARRGYPTSKPLFLYDANQGRMRKMPAALVAGVPMHGFIDLITTWSDGTEAILDHKFVSSCVSYYPPAWADYPHSVDWTMYDPNYDPSTDLQLDVYSLCTGIERAGFQFVTKRPQYSQADGTIHPDWLDEMLWNQLSDPGDKLPMVRAQTHTGDLHYVCVWRPTDQDHPGVNSRFGREAIIGRTVSKVRQTAERMTESLILYKAGVEPAIAFPAGNPDDIARKACPFCVFHPDEGGPCVDPRYPNKASKQMWRKTWAEREALCQQNPRIIELRELWKAKYSL